MIELENVFRTYKKGRETVRALDGVSLRIDEGEMVAITGPSGSGKSTLMNIIGCMDSPDKGAYKMHGKAVPRFGGRARLLRSRRIGFIFQDFNLISNMDALANVELPLRIASMPRRERRARALEALSSVELSDRVHHLPKELSGGQKQRVAIARIIAADREIIVADEPTGNLDGKSGRGIIDILKKMNACGKTVLVITHDMALAREMPRVISMENGKIVSDIKTGEMCEHAKTGQGQLLLGHCSDGA